MPGMGISFVTFLMEKFYNDLRGGGDYQVKVDFVQTFHLSFVLPFFVYLIFSFVCTVKPRYNATAYNFANRAYKF